METDQNEYQDQGGPPSPAECAYFEREYVMMSPDQPPDTCNKFESAESVRSLHLTHGMLADFERVFRSCAVFHHYRERLPLAHKYKRLALVVHELLREKLN